MNVLNDFSVTLVCTILLLVLVEMLLPDNKNKKYITFVCGVVLIIVIINPIINLLHTNIDVSKLLDENELEYSKLECDVNMKYGNEEDIRNTYIKYLKEDIKSNLDDNGYEVKDMDIEIDSETYEPRKLKINVSDKNDNEMVEKVVINILDEQKNILSLERKLELKSIINKNYNIKENNIYINKEYSYE